MRTLKLALAGLMLALTAVACAAPPAPVDGPQIDEVRATAVARSALEAFNTADYAGWSRDWSAAMRSAIPEDAFLAWRATAMEQLGSYVALGVPQRSSREPGTYRWSFPVSFERGTATIAFAFVEGRTEVEGVFVE